jgi:hypothetical protein
MKPARGIITAAVAVYLIVLGCVVLPGAAPSNKIPTVNDSDELARERPRPAIRTSGLPYKGAAIQIQRVDWLDKYKQSIDEIAAAGFDTVSLVVDARQENGMSQRIYLDMRMTPTPEKLSELIQHAKSKKLRVILMPIVLLDNPNGTEWRGTLKPEKWSDWFESYRAMIIHFAWIAEQNKVDVLSVGSELVSAESKVSEWKKTINILRGVFHGQLTYSANWDHYTSVPFWDQLDFIGMNSYYNLGEIETQTIDRKDLTVEDIKKRWAEIQTDLLKFQQEQGKPILFLEIGWCSLSNAAHEPWDYTRTELERDDELQKMLYEGFFQSWYNKPGLGGFMVWEWSPGDGGNAQGDEKTMTYDEKEVYFHQVKGYTPENKPAEKVIKEWLSKPWNPTAAAAN